MPINASRSLGSSLRFRDHNLYADLNEAAMWRTYTNTIGAATLSAYWKDPAFDATQHAFYHVRVIQIPSPRWTAYDQKRYGIKMASNVLMTVTDRAYTSPIW